jgi:mannose/fructose/N-acetylgalactosamine-specific phosphotransferase system component IIC
MAPLILCNYVLDRLVGGFSHLFSFLGLILFCGCIGFLAKCMCAISVPGLGVISINYITIIKLTKKKKKTKKSMGRDEQTNKKQTKNKKKQL